MGMTIEEAIKEIESITVVTDEKQALAFALAVHTMKKYQMIQTDYENRLKADMVAMLEEIESMFWELTKNKYDMQILYEKAVDFEVDFNSFIQQKIDKLKEAKDGENND